MPKDGSIKVQSYAFLAISLLGLGLLPFITFGDVNRLRMSSLQFYMVGFAFITICILGMIAGIRPKIFARKSGLIDAMKDDSMNESNSSATKYDKKGHHVSCDSYSSHVLKVNARVYCAGCTGLALGALLAIIASLLFFFGGYRTAIPQIIFWLGFIGVVIGLIQHPLYQNLNLQNGFFRMAINVIFVFGASLLLISVAQITDDLVACIYITGQVLLWISARIIASRYQHERICNECKETLCSVH